MDNSYKTPRPKHLDSPDSYTPEDYGIDSEIYAEYEGFDMEEELPEESNTSVGGGGDIYREIEELSTFARSNGASAEIMKALEAKKSLAMQSAALSPEKREAILEGIRAELSELQGSIMTFVEQGPARDSLKKELQDLRGELQSEVEDGEQKESISKNIAEAEQALKNMDMESAQENFEEAKGELEATKEEFKAQKAENKAEAESMLKDLEDKIEKSDIYDSTKEKLGKEVEAIRSQLDDEDVDFESIQTQLEALQKSASKELKITEMREAFTGFATKIPQFENAALTSSLAIDFANAMRSGDWSAFKSALNHFGSADANNTFHAVRQIIGTIFYDLAGSDETKLEQFLDLIPHDVRKAMYDKIMPTYAYNNHWSSNEPDRSARRLYGNYGKEVAARLEQSWQKDDIMVEENTSDPG